MNRRRCYYFFFLFFSINIVHGIVYVCDRNAPCGCSSVPITNISSATTGGEIVRHRSWEWVVSLQYLGAHRCSATLISPEYAITPAHCVDDNPMTVGWWSILAGTNNLTDLAGVSTQRRTITNVYIHPFYEPSTYRSDFAVVRFAPLSMKTNSSVSFICLPSIGEDLFAAGDHLIALGWGALFYGSTVKSNLLRQVTVHTITTRFNTCRGVSILYPITQFCADINGTDRGNSDCHHFSQALSIIALFYHE